MNAETILQRADMTTIKLNRLYFKQSEQLPAFIGTRFARARDEEKCARFSASIIPLKTIELDHCL
jgi:redox-regulated HSP33 family molecular chaperone